MRTLTFQVNKALIFCHSEGSFLQYTCTQQHHCKAFDQIEPTNQPINARKVKDPCRSVFFFVNKSDNCEELFVAISFLEYFNGISFKFHREVAKRPLPWLFVLSSWLETRRGNQDETETTKILNQPSIQQWVDILCKIKRKLYNIKNPRKAICTRCHSKYPYSSKLCWEDLLFLSLVVSSQW